MAAIFSSEQFEDYITDPVTAETAAKVANEVLARTGYVLYGRATEEGFEAFSSDKDQFDTHKVLVAALKPLAYLDKESDSRLIQERTNQTDLDRAKDKRIQALEGENAILRGDK